MRSYIHLNGVPQAGCVGGGWGSPEWGEEKMRHKGSPWKETGRPQSRHDEKEEQITCKTVVVEKSGWSSPSREQPGIRMCCCSKCWNWGLRGMAHQFCRVGRGSPVAAGAARSCQMCFAWKHLFPSSSLLGLCSSLCKICTVTHGHISQGTMCCVQKTLSVHAHSSASQAVLPFSIQLLLQAPKARELFTRYWLPRPRHGAFQITWRHKSLPTEHDPK